MPSVELQKAIDSLRPVTEVIETQWRVRELALCEVLTDLRRSLEAAVEDEEACLRHTLPPHTLDAYNLGRLRDILLAKGYAVDHRCALDGAVHLAIRWTIPARTA